MDGRELDLDGPPSTTTGLVDAGVDGESVEPGLEPVGIAKLRQVVPCPDEAVLDRVACELGVPEDQAGGAVQPHGGHTGELGKGVMIAPPRALDEPSLVHIRLGCWGDHGGRPSQDMAMKTAGRFSLVPSISSGDVGQLALRRNVDGGNFRPPCLPPRLRQAPQGVAGTHPCTPRIQLRASSSGTRDAGTRRCGGAVALSINHVVGRRQECVVYDPCGDWSDPNPADLQPIEPQTMGGNPIRTTW